MIEIISIICGATNTLAGNPIPVRSFPTAVAFDPDRVAIDSANGNICVADFGSDSVSVISTSSAPPTVVVDKVVMLEMVEAKVVVLAAVLELERTSEVVAAVEKRNKGQTAS